MPADISFASLTASSPVNTLNFTATGNTTGFDALFTQDVQTPLLRPISAVDDHLRIAAGFVSTRMVDNDGTTVLGQFSGAEVHMRVPTRCDHQLTVDDVSGTATGLLTNAVSARIGDNLLTINGGVNGVTVLGAGLAVAGVARATTQVRTPTLIADLSLQGGTTGTRVLDASNTDAEDRGGRDPTSHQGAERHQLGRRLHDRAGDQEHGHHGDGPAPAGRQHGHRLRAARSGAHRQHVPGQEIWLQNRLTGQAPLIVETNGIVTTAYGQNDLLDEKVKQNIGDADLQNGGVPAKTMWGGEELLTLDYGKLTAVL